MTNQCASTDTGYHCGLDYILGCTHALGDSGGPWFDGTVARGIHAAGTGSTCVMTRIGRVENLGFTIMK